ncbi:MAG TPA: isoprenylcysteine carboxylmethyltransferase family protein [Candidatus Acidoferrales bacterium]|nr:isoprenylcysteine carboxylmethyltransferase family protein [Candidatus Acidoferrales bacterium]
MAAAQNFWIRWRVRTGYPVTIAFLLVAKPSGTSLLPGVAIGIVGLLVRAWAAGFLRKHEALATDGPYALTRNPLYFGSAILALGVIVAGNSIWGGVLVAIYILLFYPSVMRREETELREHYGQQFEIYADRVPQFWPRLRNSQPGGAEPAKFSSELYSQNREYQAAIGFALGIFVLWTKMQWMR